MGGSSGTLSYMSPQQAMGEPATPSDDLHALGASLYELLAGKPPFCGGDIRAQLLGREPERLTLRRAALGIGERLPDAWEEAIMACLAKRARDRPASAGEFLERVQAGRRAARATESKARRGRAIGAGVVIAAAIAAAGIGLRSLGSRGQGTVGHGAGRGVAAPSTAAFTEFVDDFTGGLAGWAGWGEPRPSRLHSFQGRQGVLDNNGDDMYHSGLTSLTCFTTPNGFILEGEVFMNTINPTGCHCEACIGLTRDPNRWMNALGSAGDSGDGLWIDLNFVGDSCWGTPADRRRHLWLGASFVDESGQRVDIEGEQPLDAVQADRFANRWVRLRVEVDADRSIRFYADDKLCWAPRQRVHRDLLNGQRVVVKGRSLGTAGKAYHDWVRLRAMGAGGRRIEIPPTTAATSEVLPWRETVWKDTAGDRALPLAASDDVLRLVSGGTGDERALRSQVLGMRSFAVFFEVQPFLLSHDGAKDIAWLGLAASDGERFVGVEFADGGAWLIDTARTPGKQRVRRLGSYTPGSWQSYSLEMQPGRLDFAGSYMEAFPYEFEGRVEGWKVEIGVRHSGDGIALRPIRVAAQP
jgi:hypothetical protein